MILRPTPCTTSLEFPSRPALVVWLVVMVTMSQTCLAELPMIIGHRGASHDAPENTLAAFRLAFQQNADGIEGDFYLSQDRQIICIHDKDTERTSGRKLINARSTAQKLRTLDVGSWKHPEFADQRIPLFDEVFKVVPAGKRFVVELKTGPEIVPVLKEQLDRLDHSSIDILIIAFNRDTVRECKRLMPNLKAHWLTSFDESILGQWSPSVAEIAKVVRECDADGVGFNGNAKHIDASWIQRLKGHGIDDFHVWTIDDPVRAKQFAQWGASGLTTNRPAMIRESLNASSPTEP